MSINWSTLPEGIVSLIAAKYDGETSGAIRALRGVCKPWRADIVVTKATMLQGAELPVWYVLQKTPKLLSLTIVEASVEQCETLLAEIRIVKNLVPDLNRFVFDNCGLAHCQMSLSKCLGKNTQELTLISCWLNWISIENLCDFQYLTSLTLMHDMDIHDENDEYNICLAIFTQLPSLQFLCVSYLTIDLETIGGPTLPNITSMIIEESIVWHPKFLRGLLSLEHLILKGTSFLDENDIVLEVIGSMPSLTRLSLVECIMVTDEGLMVTDEGLMNLARSPKLTWLEVSGCEQITHEGLDALRAALTRLQISV